MSFGKLFSSVVCQRIAPATGQRIFHWRPAGPLRYFFPSPQWQHPRFASTRWIRVRKSQCLGPSYRAKDPLKRSFEPIGVSNSPNSSFMTNIRGHGKINPVGVSYIQSQVLSGVRKNRCIRVMATPRQLQCLIVAKKIP